MTRHLLLAIPGATDTECGACHGKQYVINQPWCGVFATEREEGARKPRVQQCLASERAARGVDVVARLRERAADYERAAVGQYDATPQALALEDFAAELEAEAAERVRGT
jgi:hypothetical protein